MQSTRPHGMSNRAPLRLTGRCYATFLTRTTPSSISSWVTLPAMSAKGCSHVMADASPTVAVCRSAACSISCPLSPVGARSRVCCWAGLPCRRSLTEEANTRRTPAAVATAVAHLPRGGAGAGVAAERCNARCTATVPVAIARIPKASARRDADTAATLLAARAAGAAARELKGTARPLHTRARAAAAACLRRGRPAPMALALPALGTGSTCGAVERGGLRHGDAQQSGHSDTDGRAAGCAGADKAGEAIDECGVHRRPPIRPDAAVGTRRSGWRRPRRAPRRMR